eukprot:2326879-Rhodomonas_salina.1
MGMEEVERIAVGRAGTALTLKGVSSGSGEEYEVTLVRGRQVEDEGVLEERAAEACEAAKTLHEEVEATKRKMEEMAEGQRSEAR